MRYSAGGLDSGAAGHLDVADAADRAVTALSQVAVTAGAFGTVATAAAFGAALDSARLGHSRRMAAEVAARSDLALRVSGAAGMGRAPVHSTSAKAAAARPGAIVEGIAGR
ncbi:hypothetical protein [Pseudonocardia aurantiaca]|uniref:Excreted virulence factor EspC (Type VII ESX diderm) n=1 Tax=Pseudonocardia aurantiaca TaxID=75290 RepID=A0ABW4FSK9_9PSEU